MLGSLEQCLHISTFATFKSWIKACFVSRNTSYCRPSSNAFFFFFFFSFLKINMFLHFWSSFTVLGYRRGHCIGWHLIASPPCGALQCTVVFNSTLAKARREGGKNISLTEEKPSVLFFVLLRMCKCHQTQMEPLPRHHSQSSPLVSLTVVYHSGF